MRGDQMERDVPTSVQREPGIGSGPRPSVLVVDDVEANLVAMEAQLADLDCDLVLSQSGNDALRQMLKREFAVVLLDVNMPEMDGFEVARLARANPLTREVPVIFVTAMHERSEDRIRGYGAGAVDLLYKPLDSFVLRSKVRVFLELYQSRRRLADEIEAHRKTSAEVEAFAVLIGALDVQKMLDKLAELVVPRLADWCRILIQRPAHSASAIHLEPGKLVLADELARRTAPLAEAPWGVGEVARSGRSELHVNLTPDVLRRHAPDPEELRIVQAIGVSSAMLVPLPARGQTIGVLTLLSCDRARHYTASDLALAEELGRRAGLAVDNVLLHAEAREAILARDEFLSIASHELRTPVTSLQMQHELLYELLRPGPDQAPPTLLETKLKVAVRQTARLASLIDNLLDVSRLNTGNLALDASPLDLGEVVGDVVTSYGEACRRAGCEVVTLIERGVTGHWDRLRLEQTLTNLMSNAIKFGPGKPIEIEVKREGEQAVLSVADHGIGIEEADRERIFGRFERAVSSRNYGGLGLGLYIARHSVEVQGGAISVVSTPGEGSTFQVRLPLGGTSSAAFATPTTPSASAPTSTST